MHRQARRGYKIESHPKSLIHTAAILHVCLQSLHTKAASHSLAREAETMMFGSSRSLE
jgi:hypothetical protein